MRANGPMGPTRQELRIEAAILEWKRVEWRRNERLRRVENAVREEFNKRAMAAARTEGDPA